MLYKASAPGSLMLLGEYAVLSGKPALVGALNKRITVTLTPRADDAIKISSEALGQHETSISNFSRIGPFDYVLGALQYYLGTLKSGCDIHITSDFSHEIGFGSSAAVTVATLAVLGTWLNTKVTPLNLVRQGRSVLALLQKTGSGADIAASVYGGIVAYYPSPLQIEKFYSSPPLTVSYCGYKTPTGAAIQKVHENFSAQSELFKKLCATIGQCATDGIAAMRKQDFAKLGQLMNTQQGLMEALGVNTPELQSLIETLRADKQMLGAKISGSGLGDCVIGLGVELEGAKHIPAAISLEGVQCEKI